MSYVNIIKYAALFFPLVALLFTMPFLLSQYHKYGSISLFKSGIIYLFIFYMICAYFLVILPLPKISEVAKMTSPRMQLMPFCFVIDFIEHSSLSITNIHTYIPAIKESYFYVPLFNIVLTIPFGMFLRYYFQCNIKKIIIYSFLLSLFFELTQLSGLYFIYPRGYRLFDVDDLLLNTCGGVAGYFLCYPLIKILPTIEEINIHMREKGKTISGLRRTLAFLLDLFILFFIEIVAIIFINNVYLLMMIAIIYYFVIPLFLDTSTLGKKFLNIQILDYQDQINVKRLLLRKIICISIYILIPMGICWLILHAGNNGLREFIGLIILGSLLVMYSISFIKYLFTNKDMLYEKLSKTRLVSTMR